MKKAVVFYGSMRELALGSKSWHVLGENVDYFVVTWDVVNTHHSDPNPPYPFDISTFPVPVKDSIVVNFEQHRQSLIDQNIPTDSGFAYILYHWSLIRDLSEISTYDSIVITRPDVAYFKLCGINFVPTIRPNQVSLSGNDATGINDWLLTTDATGLNILYDLYHQAIQSRDFIGEDGKYNRIIHEYLLEKAQTSTNKFINYRNVVAPVMVLIRPNYPEAWVNLEYGPEFASLIIKHAMDYEIPYASDDYDATEAWQNRYCNVHFNKPKP
jgi:hypothetical protein